MAFDFAVIGSSTAPINDTLSEKDAFLTILQNNIDTRLEELQTQLLKLSSSKADYEDVAEEIYHLRKRIANVSAFLQEQPTAITEYDEQLDRRLIERITVFENKFTV